MEIHHGVFGTGLDDEVSTAALGVELFLLPWEEFHHAGQRKFKIAKTKAIPGPSSSMNKVCQPRR